MDEQPERVAREIERGVGALTGGGKHGQQLALILDRMTRRTGSILACESVAACRIVDRYRSTRRTMNGVEELFELTGWNQAS